MKLPDDLLIPHTEWHLFTLANPTHEDPDMRWWRHELSHQFDSAAEAGEYARREYPGHPYYSVEVLWTPSIVGSYQP